MSVGNMDSAKQNDRCDGACIAYRGTVNHCGGHFKRRLKEDQDHSSRVLAPTFVDRLSILLYRFTPMAKKHEEDRYFDIIFD